MTYVMTPLTTSELHILLNVVDGTATTILFDYTGYDDTASPALAMAARQRRINACDSLSSLLP